MELTGKEKNNGAVLEERTCLTVSNSRALDLQITRSKSSYKMNDRIFGPGGLKDL